MSGWGFLPRFAVKMAERLEANDHKSSWLDMTPGQLLRRLKQEVGELDRALKAHESEARIAHEAADVANFAAMIWDVYEAPGDEKGAQR